MKKWLYSRKNLAGCGVATLGIVLYLAGVIDTYWYVIVAGMYGVTYFAVPNEKEPMQVAFGVGKNLEHYHGFIAGLIAQNKEKLPAQAVTILQALSQTSEELIEFTTQNRVAFFDESMSDVVNIFSHYLPNVVHRYVKLPTRYATQVAIKDGKTTQDFLIEQLSLLNEQMQKIAHAVYEDDARALVTHSRFLNEKFQEHQIFDLDFKGLEEEKEMGA